MIYNVSQCFAGLPILKNIAVSNGESCLRHACHPDTGIQIQLLSRAYTSKYSVHDGASKAPHSTAEGY